MRKNSFVLQTRLDAIVAKLSDKQAGVLFKSILKYAANGTVANFEDNGVSIAFEIVRQDIDYSAQKYAETCARRAESGKLGGLAKQANLANASKCYQNLAKPSKTKHIDVDNDVDVDVDIKNKDILRALPADPVKPKRKLNNLQEFSNAVIENFEPDVKTSVERGIWFKRNCRCLTDILKFCGNSIPLAIGTINACLDRMEQAKIEGAGYEAVCRNLPFYREMARKKLGGIYAETQAG